MQIMGQNRLWQNWSSQ